MARRNPHESQPGEEFTSERKAQEAPIEPATQQASGSERNGELSFQAIVELAPDAIIVSTVGGRIVLVNRQTELLFGYDRASLLGRPVEILIPERFHSAHVPHRVGYAVDPQTRVMGSGMQLSGRRQGSGASSPPRSASARSARMVEPLVIATIRDISELRGTEAARAAAEAANQELRQLLTLTDTALSSLALDDLMRELLSRARDVMGVDDVVILLLDESGLELQVQSGERP